MRREREAMCVRGYLFRSFVGTIGRYSHYYHVCEWVTKKKGSAIESMGTKDREGGTSRIEVWAPKIEAQNVWKRKILSASLFMTVASEI
jgi:hypothetical protein